MDFCASEKDWNSMFYRTFGYEESESSVDWKSLRVDRNRPFSQGMYNQPASLAEFAPWPIVMLSGTTRASIDWRKPYADALWNVGIMAAWGGRVDDSVFQRHHDFLVVMMAEIVWGCDVILEHTEDAGMYSRMEVAVAQDCKIPHSNTSELTPSQFAEKVRDEYYPIKKLPRPSQSVADILQKHIANTSSVSELASRQQGFLRRPTAMWTSWSGPILSRRGRVLPWGEKM